MLAYHKQRSWGRVAAGRRYFGNTGSQIGTEAFGAPGRTQGKRQVHIMRSPMTFGNHLLVFASDMPGLAWRPWSVGGTLLAIRVLCRPRFVEDNAIVGCNSTTRCMLRWPVRRSALTSPRTPGYCTLCPARYFGSLPARPEPGLRRTRSTLRTTLPSRLRWRGSGADDTEATVGGAGRVRTPLDDRRPP